jgi:hypothetical protein
MNNAGVDPDAFKAFEAAGWEKRAEDYDRFFRPLTSRMVEPLLDAASVTSGTHVLEIATGPGYVAGEAAARGAKVVGTMLPKRWSPSRDGSIRMSTSGRRMRTHFPSRIRSSTPSSATSPSSTWDALSRRRRSSCVSSFREAGSP